MTSITIPSTVTILSYNPFRECTSITSFSVNPNNKNYTSDNYGVLYDKEKTTLIQYPLGNERTEFTVPSGVKTIEEESLFEAAYPEIVAIYQKQKSENKGKKQKSKYHI